MYYLLTFPTFNLPMIDGMVWTPRKEIKVVRLIIKWVFVNMVNNFTLSQIAAKHLFCNKTMFWDVSLFVFKWVVGTFDFTIALCRYTNATIPIVVFFSSQVTSQALVPRNLHAFLPFIPRYTFFHIPEYNILKTYTADAEGETATPNTGTISGEGTIRGDGIIIGS